MTPTVDVLGDGALVVSFATELSAEANARVHALAASLRRDPLARADVVRDIVPAMVSLAMHVEPGTAGEFIDPLAARAREIATQVSHEGLTEGTLHEIPVIYGGEGGPDLDDVAAFARCSPADVITRHTSRVYRVYMLGFLPGFAYLGDVDPSIAAPRRAAPRTAVPSGSVGIAGLQTAVYPQQSPGGWQLIGHTRTSMFDLANGARLQPGDRVRFVVESAE